MAIGEQTSKTWSLDSLTRTYQQITTNADLDLTISASSVTGLEHYLLIKNNSSAKIDISLASSIGIYAETKSITLESGAFIELSAIYISGALVITSSGNLTK